MDTPIDHGSPASISSEDAPQDDMILIESSQTQENMFSSRDGAFGSGSAKRRQPPGGYPAGPSFSAKNRRREEVPARRTTGGSQWSAPEPRESGRNQKEELVDVQLVERLREGEVILYQRHAYVSPILAVDWGDPFDDSFVKSAS